MNQYTSVRNDFGVDQQLSFVAIDRHQNRQNPTSIDAAHEHILISYATPLNIPTTHSPG